MEFRSTHLVLVIVDDVPVSGFRQREHMRLQQAQLLSVVFVYMILRMKESEIKLTFLSITAPSRAGCCAI